MKCIRCGEELCWQSDFSYEDYGFEDEGLITIYHCLLCDASYEIFLPEIKTEEYLN